MTRCGDCEDKAYTASGDVLGNEFSVHQADHLARQRQAQTVPPP